MHTNSPAVPLSFAPPDIEFQVLGIDIAIFSKIGPDDPVQDFLYRGRITADKGFELVEEEKSSRPKDY